MKFIITKTSEWGNKKPIDNNENLIFESVIRYDRRTISKEALQAKFPNRDYSDFINTDYGCCKQFDDKAWVLEIKNLNELLKFQKNVDCEIILNQNNDYNLPTIEIYDNYRE